ncbi:ABC transporter ATP-binding protein [Paenibacillus sp. MBLB4367]|uniref:ABC transporter ATP-binding protein n=1 Tax=Paenibacillus sp. MBLB4367 TaxID=3384767 RepID=UPI0039082CA7
MWKLRSFFKPYWAFTLLAPLLMLLEVCMDLLQPKLMASIINDGVMKSELSPIWNTGLVMISVALVGIVGGVGCTVFSTIASQRFAADLRLRLFRKVQTFSFARLDRFTSGTLITRLTGDVMQLQNTVQMMLRILVRSLGLIIGSIVMAIAISPKLSLVLLFTVPLMVIVLYAVARISLPQYARMQQKLDGLNTVIQENLSGIRVVKAFVRGSYERQRFEGTNGSHLEAALKAARTVAVNMPLLMLLLNFGTVAALWFGGAQTWAGTMPVGDLIAFLSYLAQLLMSLIWIGGMLPLISRAQVSADRIHEVLESDPGMADAEIAVTDAVRAGELTFDRVSFAYGADSSKPVLQDITFTVKPGRTIGILGATGSGKSALASLIPRLYDVTGGRVMIDGIDVRDMAARHLRKSIGMVLQQAILFTGTIRDNIRYGKPDASEEEVRAAAEAADAHDFITQLPEGYDTMLGQRGVNLSGGQKQRISIARALLMRPRILILDDSTSAVDTATESRIRSSLRRLMTQSTCIVIAQRIASIRDADTIIVLENGRVAASGTHEQLVLTSDIYREIDRSQEWKEDLST